MAGWVGSNTFLWLPLRCFFWCFFSGILIFNRSIDVGRGKTNRFFVSKRLSGGYTSSANQELPAPGALEEGQWRLLLLVGWGGLVCWFGWVVFFFLVSPMGWCQENFLGRWISFGPLRPLLGFL